MIPHDLDAEKAVLSSVLGQSEAVKIALDWCSPEDFYAPQHALAFAAIQELHARGSAVDFTTVGSALKAKGQSVGEWFDPGAQALNVSGYAQTVAECAASRRAIGFGERMVNAASARDSEEVERLLLSAHDLIAAPSGGVDPGIEASELAAMSFQNRWLVPNLLERADRVIFVGVEGYGKSLLLRQMAVMLASGTHPFTRTRTPRVRVLICDLENSLGQVSRSLKRLLDCAGEEYQGSLWIKARPQGMDLRSRRDVRWLDRLMAFHRPDLMVWGPLYKGYRGSAGESKTSEEAAEQTAAALDELRVKHDCALLIEAHAPHGESGHRELRTRGSSLWRGWPEFHFGLEPVERADKQREVKLTRDARGDRETGRQWPTRLVQGAWWPWEAA